MVRMADRDCQRVRCVGPCDFRSGQQYAQHRLHLLLRCAPGANDRLFDQARRIFGDRQAATRTREQRDTARVGEFQRRLRVVVDEHLLDRRRGRRMINDHRRQDCVKMREPVGQRSLRVGLHMPVGDVADPAALDADNAPAGATQRGIEAEDDQPSFSITASGIS